MSQIVHNLTIQAPSDAKIIWGSPRQRFKILNWHRKARKTSLAMAKMVFEAAQNAKTYWYVSPSYAAAKRTVWDDPEMMPRILPGWTDGKGAFYKKNDSELKIHFSSGGNIYLIGADRPDLMRGPNPAGVVMDEYSVQRKEVWPNVIQPIVLANPDAWVWFLFTPRGKNHAYDLMLHAKEDYHNWMYSEIPITKSNIFTQEIIDQMKKEMPAQSFMQEMMCQFLEGEGSVFRHLRDVATVQGNQEPILGHFYVMGVDLGKSQDYTVITIYDRHNNNQVYQDRFNVLEWPFQKAKIAMASKRYNNAGVVLDATGVGSPIYDDLIRIGVPVTPFHFTNQSKKEIIEKLSVYIEQRYIRIIEDKDTFQEFDSYEYDYTPSGLITYNARIGTHDDIVISHALAVSELHPLNPATIPQEQTLLQAHLEALKAPKDKDELFAEWGQGETEPDVW